MASSSSSSRHHSYSRKQKSLGLLCTSFLRLYNKKGVQEVGIGETASLLGVERRRIYDIVNILESIGMVERKAKNRYTWKGFSAIPAALQELKDEGTKENLEFLDGSNDNAKISDDEEEEKPLATLGGDKSKLKTTSDSTAFDNAKISDSDEEEEEKTFATFGSESQGDKSKLKSTSDSTAFDKSLRSGNRREKSLSLVTQSFVKLFVCSNIPMITLDEAAKLLLEKESDHSAASMRTRFRRLYDIANVLSSMNLIEKTSATDTRKPAFRWLGFKGETSSESAEKAYNSNMNIPGKRKFGSDITNIGKRNKVHLFMDGQNSKTQNEKEAQPDKSNLEKDAKQTSKSCVFGPFAPATCVPKIGTSERKSVKQVHDWDSLAQVHRPRYINQALINLFSHYMEAYKSWYSETAGKM